MYFVGDTSKLQLGERFVTKKRGELLCVGLAGRAVEAYEVEDAEELGAAVRAVLNDGGKLLYHPPLRWNEGPIGRLMPVPVNPHGSIYANGFILLESKAGCWQEVMLPPVPQPRPLVVIRPKPYQQIQHVGILIVTDDENYVPAVFLDMKPCAVMSRRLTFRELMEISEEYATYLALAQEH